MSPLEILGLIVTVIFGGPIVLYTAARLIFAAYFITKQQIEKRTHHGSR